MRKNTPLRTTRRARTLSQSDLARLLEISQQTVAKYESGRLVPPFHVQARIAAILGASASELFPEPQAVA